MRLVTYASDRGPRAGIQTEAGVIDAWDLIGADGETSLRQLLASGRLDELQAAIEGGEGEPLMISPGGILAPVPDPDKIICVGLNYRAHAEETGAEIPKAPTIFGKYRNALVDLSARDLQGLTLQWMAGKVFDGAAPCGPALVTPDEAGPHDAIGIARHVNGEQRQSSSTADLIFPVPELVATLSTWMTLEPGDIISTGTPSGVGLGMDPRVWLEPGDELVVSSPQLGKLTTTISR